MFIFCNDGPGTSIDVANVNEIQSGDRLTIVAKPTESSVKIHNWMHGIL